MAHKRQSFRFRIPWWLSGAPAPRPATESLPRSESPTQPDTHVPIQRPPPPSRPPVITPAQSPPSPTKTQGAPRAEPQKQSPPHPTQPTSSVIMESSVTSQSEAPSRSTTPTPVNCPLPSLQPSSHAGSPSRVSIVSSSPKTQPQSPSHSAPGDTIEVQKPAAEESTRPPSSASVQEKENTVVSEPMPQEAEPKVNSPLKAIPKSPDTSFQPENLSIQPTAILGDEERSTTPKAPLETQSKSPETSFQPERMSTQPAGSEPQQASFVPSSSPVTKTEPTSQPQPSSPLASERTSEVLKPDAEESTLPASSASQEEKEKIAVAVSDPVPQEAEPKVRSLLKGIPKSPETSSQPERTSSQPAGSEPPQASSVPLSSLVSKTEPASQPRPSSPLASERTSEVLKPNAEESTLPASSASQEEKEMMAVAVSEPMPQEAEPKMKSPLKIIPKTPKTSSQPENLSTQPTAVLGDEERSTAPKAPLETQSKFLQSEEKEKVVHEHIKAGKAKDTATGQPIRRTIASASGTQAKDLFTRAFRADKKQHGTRETVERKIMFPTSNANEKDIRVVSSADPGTRNVSSVSSERPVSSNVEKAPLQKGIKDDISKFVHKLATVHPTKSMDDKQFSIITLAGDNRGATIHVGSKSAKKEGSIHIHRAYKTDPEESNEVTIDGEKNTKKDSHSSTKNDEVGKAYVNSNIQSINNSMMFHGSITERDPGVQVTLPQKPEEPINHDDKLGLETHKTEFNISRAEKLTYQPTVRRRCPRGLFLEPCDSDPDNPDKPRRHGCNFSCGKNKKVEDIENL